ncbi:hypothetical protein BDP27DRAFT_1413750 [Rhodocollybia butyracea]|uniref:Uncharacterized protein n=1 Tax=Rhodocollybia butyracea TaxID=206335 RepID=A0A9P5UFI9_9AGAR|nr:hypothetical protein BDP27DRAFT_1413750 [Rhodocollybia butyracea]
MLHSQLLFQPSQALSPNKRALGVFQEAIEAKEILPMTGVLSDDFEYHDLAPIPPLQDSPWACEFASNSTTCTDSLVVEVHQIIKAADFIITNIGFYLATTIEYKCTQSPRVFQSRRLNIYKFEPPSGGSFFLASEEPAIGSIHRIKGMNHSAQLLQDGIITAVNKKIEDECLKGKKQSLKWMNECCGLTAALFLGFDESQLKYSPPKTASAERLKEGSQDDDLIPRHIPKCWDLEKGVLAEEGVQKPEEGRLQRLLHIFN